MRLPRQQFSRNGKVEKLPPISMNLKDLNVGSAAALATTVTGIPLSKRGKSEDR